ncbi:DUF397 domain-containing protein [Nocardia otitidiscaviarum]|uniref:DUF397 domain-containing protein n=1 Tax=Nocardia otitidiscaviarum TaxID=1823 RepID=UPI001893AA2C|nr:DUF397 domain-containing protein [Nocardia otitidiscaviarum]MBF6238691.1 DUF397 domain-containing protein [Nocardia otitidiscaviarum]
MTTKPDFAAVQWRKSAFSQDGSACVEFAFVDAFVSLRDSKYGRDPRNKISEQPTISLPANEWHTFLGAVIGEQAAPAGIHIHRNRDGGATVSDDLGVELTYTAVEWDAFIAAVTVDAFVTV